MRETGKRRAVKALWGRIIFEIANVLLQVGFHGILTKQKVPNKCTGRLLDNEKKIQLHLFLHPTSKKIPFGITENVYLLFLKLFFSTLCALIR